MIPSNHAPRTRDAALTQTIQRNRFFFTALLLLLIAPSLLYLRPLVHGAIPYFMDTLMYFFPLRVQAARLVAGGEWPLWNRAIMGGVPLFENPQSALAYPLNWPSLAWPGGFWFTFPLTLQLGLTAALTAWALGRIGAGEPGATRSRAAAFYAGVVALAGSYGWSRLQFGNYLNVLPWWPFWLGAAHAYVQTRRPRWLAAGTLAVALMLLAGAHQLAVYGLVTLFIYGIVQAMGDRDSRRQWVIFGLLTFTLGILIAAPGWLPQVFFLRETSRAAGLEGGQVLGGAIGSVGELARALAGDWALVVPWPHGPWSDAESSAAIGLMALMLAGVVPRRGAPRRAWLALWLAALVSIAFSLRGVMEPLLKISPLAGLFHDPRRWLGVTQWLLTLNAGLGLGALLERAVAITPPMPEETTQVEMGRIKIQRIVRLLPALALLAFGAAGEFAGARTLTAVHALLGLILLLVAWPVGHERFARAVMAVMILAATALLAHATWVTTDLKTIAVEPLLHPKTKPLILQAGLQPGERFFTLDWQRAASYDYARPDLADWALPNLAMLWGVEDLGGYEPAQSTRYRSFMKQLHAPEPWRQPYAQHFGLVQNPLATDFFNAANVRAALMPRWGVPLFFQRAGQDLWQAPFSLMFREPFSVRTIFSIGAMGASASGAAPSDGATSMTIQLAAREGDAVQRFPMSAAHPLAAGDDQIATPATPALAAIPRVPAPGNGHLFAAAGELPPRQEPSVPLLAAAPQAREVLGFAWNPALSRLWQPVAIGEVASLLRYRGAPGWLASPDLPDRVIPYQGKIRANRLDLTIDMPRDAGASGAGASGAGPGGLTLEIHDAWWPGWRAWLDDRPVDVRPAGLWRAVRVPAGRHTLVLEYRPPWVAAAGVIAGAGLALLFALCIGLARRGANQENIAS